MLETSRRLQIAFLTAEDPQSKYSWSGTTYYMAQALQRHCGEVYPFGRILSIERRYIARLLHEGAKHLLQKNVAYDRLLFVAKGQGRIAARRLAGQSFDLIFAPIGAAEIAFLETSTPIMLASDVTFALQRNYYPNYSRLTKRSAQEGDSVEAFAYQKARALLFSSAWAAASATSDYGVAQEKLHVIPFGANLDEIPAQSVAINRRTTERCRLLFMGIGWERKGGAIAYETLLKLEAMGIAAELTFCGTVPPPEIRHTHVKVIPFLNKHDEQQRKTLEQLYMQSDFLLVPTRADCTPIVFCEANAFGLPVITTDTGGVSSVIRNGENGFTLPLSARGDEYAQLIAQLYQDEQRYRALVHSSRAAFEERLNWDAWGQSMQKVIAGMLANTVPVH